MKKHPGAQPKVKRSTCNPQSHSRFRTLLNVEWWKSDVCIPRKALFPCVFAIPRKHIGNVKWSNGMGNIETWKKGKYGRLALYHQNSTSTSLWRHWEPMRTMSWSRLKIIRIIGISELPISTVVRCIPRYNAYLAVMHTSLRCTPDGPMPFIIR